MRVILVIFLLWLAPAIALGFLLGWSYLKDARAARASFGLGAKGAATASSDEERQAPKDAGPKQDRGGDDKEQLANTDPVAVNLRREAHEIQ